mgnify:CR=1 FL=1
MKKSVVMVVVFLMWAGPRLDFQATDAGHGWIRSAMAAPATIAMPAAVSTGTFRPSVQVEGDQLAVIVEG